MCFFILIMERLEDACKENNQKDSSKKGIRKGISIGFSALYGAAILGLGAYYVAKKCGASDELAVCGGVFSAVAGAHGGVISGQDTYGL